MASILVINDDPVQLHLLASWLEKDYFAVHRFVCSEEAWQWLQEGNVPDVIVLDLHMPGISGWRFCELLHSFFGSTQAVPSVLAVSATYTGIDAQDILKDLGASAFLALPTDPQRFRQQVRQLVESPPSPLRPQIWMVSADHSAIQGIHHLFVERGWRVVEWEAGKQVQVAVNLVDPDIILIDDPLPDATSDEFGIWCKGQFPQAMCILLGNESMAERSLPEAIHVDAYLPKACDPFNIISLCEKGRWERAFSRVEHLLDIRTDDLRESEAQFRELFETLPDILVIYDHRGMITHVNSLGAQQLGYRPPVLMGKAFSVIKPESADAESSPTAPNPARGGRRWEETFLRQKNGSNLPVEMMERTVQFQGQRQTLFIARDLTARKHMEEEKSALEHQLRQVQKMEAIGRLASGVAHDMNNTLTAIMAHASLLKIQDKADTPLWAAGDVIEKAVRRGKELTSQLLGYARQGKHHHVTVDTHEVIQEVMNLLGRTIHKMITFRADLSAMRPHVVGDPNQLYQILMNLSVNACDAMGERGELLIQTSNETVTPEYASRVPGLCAGDYVVIRVTDTGTGMSLETQRHIFEPFFTTKEQGQGTGMGLAMVYGIVKNHYGYIGVTSSPGCGTTMRVYLPDAPCATLMTRSTQKTEPSHGTGHILVVDDEKDVGEAAQAILEFLGYQVTVVLNGKDAVAICQDPTTPVDVVLLDMVMPVMSGAACFEELRRIRPDLRVILCTGYDRNHAVQDLLNQGVIGFIQKPYDVDELAHACQVVLTNDNRVEPCGTGRTCQA
ncbi:ATP-binding response regulator [Candidatus Nitrospira neomarina]|uniref:histidine kinase n=1 Tax=Candidatus Nitrospira neomarina TaxID=3020899 RepID=A0AA96JWR2_9BACT|nr:response regulator [Candidatus Nitrospira neomarina]WNM62818.1 response regulator [Candidatus Nitrospira neomarina]